MNEPNKENQAETPELDKETSYEVIAIDNSVTELFDKELSLQKPKTKLLSYIPSFFTTASLPFKNIHKTFQLFPFCRPPLSRKLHFL